jgi:hypothetical protein
MTEAPSCLSNHITTSLKAYKAPAMTYFWARPAALIYQDEEKITKCIARTSTWERERDSNPGNSYQKRGTLQTSHASSGKNLGLSTANQNKEASVKFKERCSLSSPLDCICLTDAVTQWDWRRLKQTNQELWLERWQDLCPSHSHTISIYVQKKSQLYAVKCVINVTYVYRYFVTRQPIHSLMHKTIIMQRHSDK